MFLCLLLVCVFVCLFIYLVMCLLFLAWSPFCHIKGGLGSSAVEHATPGEEVPGSIPAVAARSLLVRSVSV